MSDARLRQIVQDKRWPNQAAGLDRPLADVLRRAAGQARRWTQVEQAWSVACRPAWRGLAAPVAFKQGVLTIATRDSATMFEVQRTARLLLRDFRSAGVSRIVVIVAARLEAPPDQSGTQRPPDDSA